VTVMKRFWLSFFWCCGWCQAQIWCHIHHWVL